MVLLLLLLLLHTQGDRFKSRPTNSNYFKLSSPKGVPKRTHYGHFLQVIKMGLTLL